MTVATATEVFDFMGTETDLRTGNATLITNLIANVQQMIEDYIDRYIEVTASTEIKIHEGRYCSVIGNKIYMNDKYFDIYSISSFTEDGTALVEGTDYVLTRPNIIERIDSYWAGVDQLGLVITGVFGMGYSVTAESVTTVYPHKGLKEILIESVATLSGLWGKAVSDGEGNDFVVSRSSLPKFSKDMLNMYKQYVV